MARIAVDIDSTLYDFESPAREAFLRLAEQRNDPALRRGAYDPWTQWRSPADSCGLDVWLDAIAMVHNNNVIESRVPFDGAMETCWALVDQGHELLYISNRATETEQATREWLVHQDFPMDPHGELVVLTGKKDGHLANCQYLIDDRVQTCLDFIYDMDWNGRRFEDAAYVWETGDGLPGHISGYFAYPDNFHEPYIGQIKEEFLEWHEKQSKRRAYMLMYPYNHNLTDCHGLYLAPTWAGLNSYMVKHGLLDKPAYVALGS